DPIGKTVPLGGPQGNPPTVVGVIGDIHGTSLADDVAPEMFLPSTQAPLGGGGQPTMWIAIRGARSQSLGPALMAAVKTVDPEQPIAEITSVDQMMVRDQSALRLNTTLVTIFALVAALLAVVGIYGVTGY